MLKKSINTLLILITLQTFAQVGINTTTPAAQLDIKATNTITPSNTDGILIPRIDTFPATNPTSLQQGMLVYLTTTSGASTPGFYYWDNTTTSWKTVGNTSSSSWNLTGNTGTNPATMFIGTTDFKDLIFKRNNTFAGHISYVNTSFGYQSFSGNLGFAPGTSAFGVYSLQKNTGIQNSAFGESALKNNTTGSYNTAVGSTALEANTTGNENSALGTSALAKNTTGNSNVAIGVYNSFGNTTGNYNTSIGKSALFISNGSFNTAVGYSTLSENTTGTSNTAVGRYASILNTTGNENTAFGSNALYTNSIGNGNTALGSNTMKDALAGNYNTAIGYNAYNTTGTYSNSTAIGYDATINGDNQVKIGNSNITYAGIQVAWSITSDKRWKENIKTSNLGLDFISKLNPVYYNRKNDKSNKTEYGFIAQDLNETLQKLGITNSNIITKDENDKFSIRYNDLMAPIVKAIQEQQTTIQELENKNKALENKLIQLEKKLEKLANK